MKETPEGTQEQGVMTFSPPRYDRMQSPAYYMFKLQQGAFRMRNVLFKRQRGYAKSLSTYCGITFACDSIN